MKFIKPLIMSFLLSVTALPAAANNGHMTDINKAWDDTYFEILNGARHSDSAKSQAFWLDVYIKDTEAYVEKVLREIGSVTDSDLAWTTFAILVQIEADVESLIRSDSVPEATKTKLRQLLVQVSLAKEAVYKRYVELVKAAGGQAENFEKFNPKPSPIVEVLTPER